MGKSDLKAHFTMGRVRSINQCILNPFSKCSHIMPFLEWEKWEGRMLRRSNEVE